MSFATGFNTGGSSAFPLAIVNNNGSGASDIAHDPRTNRGGAGGILKATTLITRNAGRTVPIYNSLPDQWYGTGVNSPNGGPAAASLFNRFTGSVSLAADANNVVASFGIPLQAQTAALTQFNKSIIPTIPWTYLTFVSGAAGTGGWVLDLAKVRFQYCASTVGSGVSTFNTLPAGGVLTLTNSVVSVGGAGPRIPALVLGQTGGGNVSIDWTLDLLPPSVWGAGFIGTDGSVATTLVNFLNI